MKHERVKIDKNGAYVLDLRFDPKTQTLSGGLKKNPYAAHKDLRIEKRLADKMAMTVGGEPVSFSTNNHSPDGYYNWFSCPVKPDQVEDITLSFHGKPFFSYDLHPQSSATFRPKDRNPLTAFEMRLMARQDDMKTVPFIRDSLPLTRPKTDLHTHFAAIPTADDMLNLALEKQGNPVIYPCCLLDKLNISYGDKKVVDCPETPAFMREKFQKRYNGKGVPLRRKNFNAQELGKIRAAMAIPVDQQGTFMDLETVYDYRVPMTKNAELFVPLLRAVGQEYRRQGIKYAEITHTTMTDPKWVELMSRHMPEIEKESGVKMRFLAGLVRHLPEPINMLKIEKIKQLAKNPYLVGVDFIGQETNSTKSFGRQLEKLARFVKEKHPDFVLRVHAGENAKHKDNVKDALRIAKKHGVRMRIGHGLYGVDDQTIKLFKETNTIVEFNMHSNLALNNIDGLHHIPIARFLNEGVGCVLGQDGGGIYQTDAGQEMLVARFAGVGKDGVDSILKTEADYMAYQEALFERESARPNAFKIDYDKMPEEEPYKKASSAFMRRQKNEQVCQRRLLEEKGFNFKPKEREEACAGRTPILISGSSSTFSGLKVRDRREIGVAMKMLLRSLDMDKVYFVTSGHNHGVENHFRSLSQKVEKKPLIVASMAEDTKADDTKAVGISHALFAGKNRSERSEKVLKHVAKTEGEAIFIGGGMVVNDQIQDAMNHNLSYHLMDGPEGAASNKALFDKNNSFQDAKGLIQSLYAAKPALFRKDFDPREIQKMYQQERSKVASQQSNQYHRQMKLFRSKGPRK